MIGAVQAASVRFQPAARSDLGPVAVPPSILAGLAPTHAVAGQEVLFHEGDGAASLFEVARGVVRLYRLLPDGRRCVTGFAFAGSLLGLSFRDAYIYTAEAITPCEIRQCARGAVARQLDSKADFRHRMLTLVTDELCAAQDQMLLLGRKSAQERVVSFLLWAARKLHGEAGDSRTVDFPMTRADIADYLGLTTETVSRELTKLRQAKLINLPSPQHVEFLRRDLLREIADNGEVEVKAISGRFKPARWPS